MPQNVITLLMQADGSGVKKTIAEMRQDLESLKKSLNDVGNSQTDILRINEAIAKTTNQIKLAENASKGFSISTGGVSRVAKTAHSELEGMSQSLRNMASGSERGVDALSNLVFTFERLRGQAGGVEGALKGLGQSLLGPAGIVLGVTTLISFLPQLIEMFDRTSESTKKLNTDINTFKEQLDKLSSTSIDIKLAVSLGQTAGEQERLVQLGRIVGDPTKDIKARETALKSLQSQYERFKSLKLADALKLVPSPLDSSKQVTQIEALVTQERLLLESKAKEVTLEKENSEATSETLQAVELEKQAYINFAKEVTKTGSIPGVIFRPVTPKQKISAGDLFQFEITDKDALQKFVTQQLKTFARTIQKEGRIPGTIQVITPDFKMADQIVDTKEFLKFLDSATKQINPFGQKVGDASKSVNKFLNDLVTPKAARTEDITKPVRNFLDQINKLEPSIEKGNSIIKRARQQQADEISNQILQGLPFFKEEPAKTKPVKDTARSFDDLRKSELDAMDSTIQFGKQFGETIKKLNPFLTKPDISKLTISSSDLENFSAANQKLLNERQQLNDKLSKLNLQEVKTGIKVKPVVEDVKSLVTDIATQINLIDEKLKPIEQPELQKGKTSRISIKPELTIDEEGLRAERQRLVEQLNRILVEPTQREIIKEQIFRIDMKLKTQDFNQARGIIKDWSDQTSLSFLEFLKNNPPPTVTTEFALKAVPKIDFSLETMQDRINKLTTELNKELKLDPKNLRASFERFIHDGLSLKEKETLIKLGLKFDFDDSQIADLGKIVAHIKQFIPKKLDVKLDIALKAGDIDKLDFFNRLANMNEEITAILQEGVANMMTETFATIGESLGTALVGGDIQKVLQSFTTTIGDLLETVGKALIKAGVEMLLAKKALALLFTNPGTAIIAGIALVALGAALKSQVEQAQKVQGKQSGGPVKKGDVYLVGEVGPEIFVPKKDGYIIPNHSLSTLKELGGSIRNENQFNTSSTNYKSDQTTIFGSINKKSISGLRQMGGSVLANNQYLVGETGMELYVPNLTTTNFSNLSTTSVVNTKIMGGMKIEVTGTLRGEGQSLVATINQVMRTTNRNH